MALNELLYKRSYKSYDEDDLTIPNSFLNPCLKETILYQRSVGYFSSSVFSKIQAGMNSLIHNNGKIQLITTPMLSKEDIMAINTGLMLNKSKIIDEFELHFIKELEKLNDKNLLLLVELLSTNKMEIKIVTTKQYGEYHDKLGIFTDFEGNKVVFFGSSNSSNNGYSLNYEKIRIARSWVEYENEIVKDEVKEFEQLWDNKNSYVNVIDYTSAAKLGVLKVTESRGLHPSNSKQRVIELRDYQKDAINAWKENQYNGFFVMATGTGKTFTAIYGLKQLVSEEERVIVICAPYKHLIKQWCLDLEKVFPDANIIMAFSENAGWDNQIKDAIFKSKYQKKQQLIIVSTIVSFQMDKFNESLKSLKMERVLVVDEAHRFVKRDERLKKDYKNMLGLSATPTNGKNLEEAKKLMDFFGGQVFNLPIEKALGKFLVPYNYYPIFISATEDEEDQFNIISRNMASCFRYGICIDKDKLLKLSRRRLRLISNAENKINKIDDIISNQISEKDHLVVYCGDGKLFQDEADESKYINYVKDILSKHNYKVSQFTASENMRERMELVEMFDEGVIDSLAAIRCLDEGINIPSIKAALILSSNDDLKEFVQRRGRILRKYNDKKFANIYDVIVLPSSQTPGMAKIELRRVYEYARLSQNFEEYKEDIYKYLEFYHIELEEILINDEFFEEDNQDE